MSARTKSSGASSCIYMVDSRWWSSFVAVSLAFNCSAGIESGPGDLFGFMFLMQALTSSRVITVTSSVVFTLVLGHISKDIKPSCYETSLGLAPQWPKTTVNRLLTTTVKGVQAGYTPNNIRFDIEELMIIASPTRQPLPWQHGTVVA